MRKENPTTELLLKRLAAAESENALLKSEVVELRKLVGWLQEQFKLAQQRKFGRSAESFPMPEQLSVYGENGAFNEAEAAADAAAPEPELEVIREHFRKKRTRKESLPEDLPVTEVLHPLSAEQKICPGCGGEMHICGHEQRDELVVIPATVEIRRHITETAGCRHCEQTATGECGDAAPMVKSEMPKFPISGSYASAEAIAYSCTQKFLMGVPLYRQEKDWERQGILLSRQTMSNWQVRCADLYFNPLVDRLMELLLDEPIIYADETSLQVLKTPEGREKKEQGKSYKCYMWFYGTGGSSERKIAVFRFHAGRGGENPKNDLKGFAGFLHCDGYQVYHSLPSDITIVGCWVHARRKFADLVKIAKGGDKLNGVPLQAVRRIDKLFALEEEWKELPPDERQENRTKYAKPLIDEYFRWLGSLAFLPNSKLGEAVGYSFNQRKYLENYLLDGRLEPSNNLSERAIKPFAIDRKNFLFSNTENGAAASAAVFSLIETAKANGLNPYKYLVYILNTAPNLNLEDEAQIDALLPWNAPPECKNPKPGAKS